MRILHSLWPTRVGFTILLLVELLGAGGVLPIKPEFTWKGMILQSVAIWAFLELVRYLIDRHDFNMSLGPGALLVLIQTAVDAVGDMGHLYGRFEWYDQILHFSGGLMVAIVATALFRAIHEKQNHTIFPRAEIMVGGFGVAMAAQVLYEAEEYLEDVLTGSQRLGDGFDTANDLVLGLFGAVLGALIVVVLPKLTAKR
ncbi:MAG: hypothetical protein V1895_02115 [Parcubacteria group bacterium]